MRRRMVILGFCAAIVAIGMSAWLLYMTMRSNASVGWGEDYFVAPTQKQGPVDEADIVYPGASLVAEDKGDGRYPHYRHTYWRTIASEEVVRAYLETHLPETGWVRSKDPY